MASTPVASPGSTDVASARKTESHQSFVTLQMLKAACEEVDVSVRLLLRQHPRRPPTKSSKWRRSRSYQTPDSSWTLTLRSTLSSPFSYDSSAPGCPSPSAPPLTSSLALLAYDAQLIFEIRFFVWQVSQLGRRDPSRYGSTQ